MKIPSSVEQYIDILRSGDFSGLFDFDLPLDGDFSRSSLKLLMTKSSHPFVRRRLIKRILARLCRMSASRSIRLRFSYSFGERAYMRDSGLICISVPYLVRASGESLFCILMHEVAHLLLLCSEGYSMLLSLDGEFLTRYNRLSEYAKTISPVEFFATRLSLVLMEGVSESADAVQASLIDGKMRGEVEKLERAAKDFLKAI